MKIKTSELTGAALDWAVAKCTETEVQLDTTLLSSPLLVISGEEHLVGDFYTGYNPSTDWSQGGPIIDREDITVGPWGTSPAFAQPKGWPESGPRQVGPTKLIAAMRCFVASRLGDEVDVPEELL